MSKQELLKQADYAFQRGNRELARKYLKDLLAQHPQEESAWMLMAKIEQTTERKAEYFKRVLKINPNNNEAILGLTRVKQTLDPILALKAETQKQASESNGKNARIGFSVLLVLAFIGLSAIFVARNNPDSMVAKALAIPTPTLSGDFQLESGVAAQTRASVEEKYPQYSYVADILIGLALESAANGMEGAPERPGAEIKPSNASAIEAVALVEEALPETGTLSTLMLNELQATSWMAAQIENNPDLPFSDPQIYLRDDKIQFWGMIKGETEETSTSALITGMLDIDANGKPYFTIESIQVGKTVVPQAVNAQMQSWINQVLSDRLASSASGLEVMNVNISNGLMTVSAMR